MDKVVFTFDTTSDSLAFEKMCKGLGLPERLIPVPRKITAGCGYAWQAPASEKQRICQEAQAQGRRWAGIYEL